jgi:hypothetical protein
MTPELAQPRIQGMREDNEIFLRELLPILANADISVANWYTAMRCLGLLDRGGHIAGSDFQAHEICALILAELADAVGAADPNICFFTAQTYDGSRCEIGEAGECRLVVDPDLKDVLSGIVPNWVGTLLIR